jgi:small-conductance mechanosensitive channel
MRALAAVICAALGVAATPVQSVAPSTAASVTAAPKTAGAPQSAGLADSSAVISYLSDVISWYRHLAIEAALVREPTETLYYSDDRQMAGQVLDLAFSYAHAEADLLAKSAATTTAAGGRGVSPAPTTSSAALQQRAAQADEAVKNAQMRLSSLQAKLAAAPRRERATLESQVAAAQSELDLAQARVDALQTLSQLEGGATAGGGPGGLSGQIDELERSVPEAERTGKQPAETPVPAVQAGVSEPSGIGGLASDLFALRRKISALDEIIDLTNALNAHAARLRDPLAAELARIDARAGELTKENAAGDIAALRARQTELQDMVERHKLAAAALLPLSKQSLILGLYVENLGRWRGALERRETSDLMRLAARLVALGVLLGVIFVGALIWRRITFRYVQDIRRRSQILAARRFVVALLIALVVFVNFASELGSFATVMGLAAAGVAVALQNVILSAAGYFFLIGKFGIKTGDRVQIGGVTGDVIDVGLVKLSLLELTGDGNERQPTGRVVVFSNSVVFQPNGNFFKQAPGSSFIWNEVRLTLSPECDYRLAEKRLVDAVDEVFSRYREQVQRDYRHLAVELNLLLETPRPQSRLSLTNAGLELIIRYPADAHNAPQIGDEVARRLLDALNREPTLKLAVQGVPNIQPAPEAPALEAAAAKPDEGNGGLRAQK